MIAWGGGYGTVALGDGARYNPTTNAWTSVADTDAPSVRDGHTAVWTGSEMCVWGGYSSDEGHLNTGACYTPPAP